MTLPDTAQPPLASHHEKHGTARPGDHNRLFTGGAMNRVIGMSPRTSRCPARTSAR
jgi:hypothetical protein